MNTQPLIFDGPLPETALPRETSLGAVAGAVVRFDGIVRRTEGERTLEALEYQVYEPMSTAQLQALADHTVKRFGLRFLAVAHSRGRVPVGCCSFRLLIAATHRAEGLAAAAWFIDHMKRDVPIWKLPVYACDAKPSPGATTDASGVGATLDEVIDAWCAGIKPLGHERIPWHESVGRILAEPVVSDRASPACDISAMDGYALRIDEREGTGGVWSVAFEVQAGRSAPSLPGGVDGLGRAMAARIFTGAMVPAGADAVVPREQVREWRDRIEMPLGVTLRSGQHIRRTGENAPAGRIIARPGRPITPGLLAAATACGFAHPLVVRRVRVAIVITGDEVLQPHQTPEAWQLRDSNGPALLALLRASAWLEPLPLVYAPDRADGLTDLLRQALQTSDAMVVTGGVSAGDHDHVAHALRNLGVNIAFHKLPIRPGKPILAGTTTDGRPVVGLPGNPVSAMVTAVRFAGPALRRRADILPPAHGNPSAGMTLALGDERGPSSLTWFPLVRLSGDGSVHGAPNMGSGDWVAAACSDGFIEVPPGESVRGVRRLFHWTLDPAAPIGDVYQEPST